MSGMVHGQDAAAGAASSRDQHLPSVWDLELGTHARLLPTDDFSDFACGTNGGPPSNTLTSWTGYNSCPPDAATGLHEVYFEYDDEAEYRGRARNLDLQVMRHEYTRVNGVPVIASALFDSDGFLVGLRLVTDPRVPVEIREKGTILGGFLAARFGEQGWTCTDLPRQAGESEYKGVFIKRQCERTATEDGLGVDLSLLTRSLRGKGETIIGWDQVPTEGAFESSTRFDLTLSEPLSDKAERLAAVEALGTSEANPDVKRALDCAGCDLRGLNLKRADLTGANLAGANLSGANLHAANLRKANLAGANLSGANLNRADLRAADLTGADLSKAMLYGGSLDGAKLTGANLNGALAGRSRFIRADLSNASMRAVDLRHGRLNDANLARVDLSNSWVSDGQLTRADLTGATLIYVRAIRTNLSNARLAGVDARGADFFGASLYNADLAGADFSYTRLLQANLWSAKLDDALFEEAELPAGFEQLSRRAAGD